MNTKHKVIIALSIGVLSTSSVYFLTRSGQGTNLRDEALLALIKNDQDAFESFLKRGGDVHLTLPKIDGKEYTIAEGLSYFERPNFVKVLQDQKKTFVQQTRGDYDIMSLAIHKNNSEMLDLLAAEKPKWARGYGKKGWNLLHIASAECSHKLTKILHEKGKLGWSVKAKDGSTPLTLAAESDCLPMLSYWKDQKANFHAKDGRGLSAMTILQKKKDAALVAFVESFESRRPAMVIVRPQELKFYNKRKIPKDQIVDHTAIVEPEVRPLGTTETAEFSEFAD